MEPGMLLQLGLREPAKNFRRIVKTLDVLGQERLEFIENVDMRYPDGYSITWKSGASPDLKDTGRKRKT
jgi:cell division protein FtsQ